MTRKERNAAYYKQNKERIKVSAKEYREENVDYYREYNREYSQRNKSGLRQKQNERDNRRYQEDPEFRMRMILRQRVRSALESQGLKKSRRTTINLIGCTVAELKVHLEFQFKEGMSWANQGKDGWDIDHIKPCANFDLTDPEQQKQCFHYTNLQPLWHMENVLKSNK